MPTADERRLLELLGASDDGATDALLRAHGFTLEVIINIVSTGLATAKAERTFCRRRSRDRNHTRADHRGRAADHPRSNARIMKRPRTRRARLERFGVYLPVLKAIIIDAITQAGDVVISVDELIYRVWRNDGVEPHTVTTHVWQINNLLAGSGFRIECSTAEMERGSPGLRPSGQGHMP
jgi:hypothetical protein